MFAANRIRICDKCKWMHFGIFSSRKSRRYNLDRATVRSFYYIAKNDIRFRQKLWHWAWSIPCKAMLTMWFRKFLHQRRTNGTFNQHLFADFHFPIGFCESALLLIVIKYNGFIQLCTELQDCIWIGAGFAHFFLHFHLLWQHFDHDLGILFHFTPFVHWYFWIVQMRYCFSINIKIIWNFQQIVIKFAKNLYFSIVEMTYLNEFSDLSYDFMAK